MEKRQGIGLKTTLSVSFLLMVAINALANALKLGGLSTGEVSGLYPNLFAPAGYAFAIWGLIYLLGALHVLYQLGIFRCRAGTANEPLLKRVAVAFSVSSLANAAWVFCWHYRNIPLSTVMILVMLTSLAYIMVLLRKTALSTREKLLVRLPFSVYFGWITVATIANLTVLLVALGWDRWGLSEAFWTAVVLIAGAAIGAAWIHFGRDPAYGLVLVWAYAGILVRHLTAVSPREPVVIAAVCLSIAALAADIVYAEVVRRRRPAPRQTP